MSDYEALRQRHLARAMTLAPQLIEQIDWPAERLAAHRTMLLRELVRTATERSPWYRQRLAGVDIGHLDETTLPQLPVLTKTELMEHFDGIVTDSRLSLGRVEQHLKTVETGSYLAGGYTAITSGGSTGQRAVFVYDWDGWAVFWLSLFRGLLRAKIADPELAGRPAVMANVAAAHFSHATAAMARTFTGPQIISVRFPVTLPTEEIVTGLNSAQPDFLLAYPSALHVLAHEAVAGRLRITPRRILAGAEPLLPEIRAAAEEVWGVKVINCWGTSEGGGTGVGCDHGGTHFSEDQLIVEPVDLDGQPAPTGERSAKVYLTNLYNRALPLIRYEITDEVTVLPEPCPCGSAHRRIADIQGRLDDVFVYRDRRVHPHLFRSELGRESGVVEYQVRQTPLGARIAIRCSAPVNLDALSNRIVAALARSGMERPEVTIEAVSRLERPGGPAKLKRFVPLAENLGASSQPQRTLRSASWTRLASPPGPAVPIDHGLYGNAVDLHDGGSGVPRAAADDLHFEGSARLYASQDQAGATGEPRWKTRPPAFGYVLRWQDRPVYDGHRPAGRPGCSGRQ